MVLVITNNDNTKNIVRKYIHLKEIVVEKLIGKFDIYIDKEFMKKNLEQFDKIIIDITDFIDSKEEILKAITRIKIIYNIQIIIIALKYKVGNELLSNLFDIGIYDFIISEDEDIQREECIKAINKNNYIDAIRFKINTNEKKKKIKKVSKNKLKKNLKENEEQVNKKILACSFELKNKLSDILIILWHGIITLLISVGATALLNSNIRQLIIEIIKGGI